MLLSIRSKAFNVALAGCLAIALLPNAIAAQTVELCALLDGSGSIISTDFTLQAEGLASAVEDPTILPQNSTVTVSVVQFSSTAQTEVSPTLIDSQATADSVAATIRAMTQIGGSTRIDFGIDQCTSLFAFTANKQTIDVSTDGEGSGDPVTAADNAVAAGVDVINALGVGSGVDVTQLEAIVRPQPPSTIPDDGFVLLVADFNEFAQAVAEKIQAETGGGVNPLEIPTLSTWMLFVLGLMLAVSAGKLLR